MSKIHHYKKPPSEREKKVFSRFLAEDEELVLATSFGSIYLRSVFIVAMAWPGFVPFFLSLGAAYLLGANLMWGFGIGILLMLLTGVLKAMHAYHANRYLLTTRRVIIKRGVFNVEVTTALYDKVTHIEVIQSFFDKLFMHHGHVKVNTAGISKDEIFLHYVEHPIEFKNILERLINRERELFGLRPGSVTTVEGELV